MDAAGTLALFVALRRGPFHLPHRIRRPAALAGHTREVRRGGPAHAPRSGRRPPGCRRRAPAPAEIPGLGRASAFARAALRPRRRPPGLSGADPADLTLSLYDVE